MASALAPAVVASKKQATVAVNPSESIIATASTQTAKTPTLLTRVDVQQPGIVGESGHTYPAYVGPNGVSRTIG